MIRPNRRHILTGLGAAGLGAWATPSGAARRAPAIDLIWGVNGHPFQAYPGIPFEAQLDLVLELGMTQYRVGDRPEGLERLLPLAAERGITLLPILHPPGNWTEMEPAALYDACAAKAEDFARRFHGVFPVLELGNELEVHAIIQPCEMRDDGTQYPCEWGPAGGVGPLEYFGPRWDNVSAALHGLSDGATQGDPQARRAMGTAGWGHLGAFKRMQEDGLTWDITVWHDYEMVRESYLEELAGYGKPIWITEFNAGGGGFESEAENARLMRTRIDYYRAMRDHFNIEAAFVYELLDEPYWGEDFEAKMGLYRVEGSKDEGWHIGEPKPVGTAVKDALRSN